MIDVLKAIFLGVVEGVTEFLPISSTGHLIVAEHLVGFKDVAEVFTVVIQTGAIASVVWYYRHDLWHKVAGLVSGDKLVRRFWVIWISACVPAGIAGLLLSELVSSWSNPTVIGWMLVVGGVVIWLIESRKQPPKPQQTVELQNITLKQALGVGLYQVLALVPGVSRSGATIMGGLLVGLDRVTAASFSFYLSIPLLLLAAVYKLAKHGDQIGQVSGGSLALIVGTVVSFVSAFVSIKWLLRYVSNHNFKPFAYYRIAVGVVILVLVTANWL
jgi:undecaprenyl-diphosphatase